MGLESWMSRRDFLRATAAFGAGMANKWADFLKEKEDLDILNQGILAQKSRSYHRGKVSVGRCEERLYY